GTAAPVVATCRPLSPLILRPPSYISVSHTLSGVDPAMQGKVCLVTGANRGIGKEIARQLARAGWTVMIHSRTAANAAATVAELKAETGNEAIRGFHADFLVQDEVRRLAAEVIAATDRLHLLVNNAGTFNLYRTAAPDGHEA